MGEAERPTEREGCLWSRQRYGRRASRLVALPIVAPTDTGIRLSLSQCIEHDTRLLLVPAPSDGLTGAQNS